MCVSISAIFSRVGSASVVLCLATSVSKESFRLHEYSSVRLLAGDVIGTSPKRMPENGGDHEWQPISAPLSLPSPNGPSGLRL